MLRSKSLATLLLALSLIVCARTGLLAGGFIETIDITGLLASPIPGHFIGRLVPIRWDTRSLPVRYSMNTSLPVIPNPLGAPFLTAIEAQTALQASFDAWNTIPTSYIDMQIVSTTARRRTRGFDFVNELTFRTAASFAAIASSPSVTPDRRHTWSTASSSTETRDSDVAGAIDVATDVDGDGDIEFPAGFYKAGTILDNDVQFNTKTVERPAVHDGRGRSRHRRAIGRLHGRRRARVRPLARPVAHARQPVQRGRRRPGPRCSRSSTRATRRRSCTAVARHRRHRLVRRTTIPRAPTASGLAALQAGDTAFVSVYGLIKGELRHGVLNQPIAGGSVAAYRWDDGTFVGAGFSGTTQVSVNPVTGGLVRDRRGVQTFSTASTVIPVPKGTYAVGAKRSTGRR